MSQYQSTTQNQTVPPRQVIISEVQALMGYPTIDVELDPIQYETAVTVAFQRYRQRSGNAMEESFIFLDLQPDTNMYILPDEVQEVRTIYRRSIGGTAGGAAIDPFSLAFTNNIYLIQNPGGLGGSGSGMLATYDFAMQFQYLTGRMFGLYITYTWDTASKKLTLHRKVTNVEQVLLHVYNSRPESILIKDVYARPWIRDYTLAQCKRMLGEIRSKFGSIAGPQGGITLNGEAMKQEAKEEIERLDKELENFIDQHEGMPFIIG